ncbi:uncharacterized protein LOC142336169 [Convolutriloba macropyga]|uniref:uncharacterized protein LOC142336169 n=1 Tax=Convolutriloba macropyga TaxID=536237 RepID=UPI003F520F8E
MDVFKDLITCQICSNQMNDPRCLPCLHAFCLPCLQKLSSSQLRNIALTPSKAALNLDGNSNNEFQCPSCKSTFVDLVITDLPQDFKVVQIIEKLQQREVNESLNCFEHKKKLELFCCSPGCLTPICYKCSITSHQNHEVAELQDHYKSLLDSLVLAERKGQQTVDNCNMYRNREVRLKTLGDKLKQLVEHKVKFMILQENLKTGPADAEASPENGAIQVLNRLQLRLLDVKERISDEGRNNYMSSTPVQMRELHEAVVRVITELNNECYNALTSVRAKQSTAVDMDSFSDLVRDFLTDGVCGDYVDSRMPPVSAAGGSGSLASAPLVVVQTELPCPSGNVSSATTVDISPAGSRKSLDSVGLSGGVGAEGGVIGGGLVTFTDSNPVLDEAFSSRCDDATSVVSSTAAGSDLIAAAMTTYSLDDTGSTCSSKHESPIRRPPMMQPQQSLQQQAMQHQPLPHHQPVAPVLVPTFNGCISPIASSPIPQQQQTQSSYSEVRNNAQVILRFQVVNPTFDKFTDIRDCALLGEDFAVIDKRNEWIKSFDIQVGRYIGTNNKGFTISPVGVHTLTHSTMLLVEENERGFCELYFVDKDLMDKSPFVPDLPINERIHDVCTSPTGQIILSTKSMNVYEQHAITSEFGTRMSKWREPRFNLLFNANFMISHMAVSATGFIALGNAEDNLIYLYDRNGRHKWKFPVRENTSFKRLKQINFDLAGNLITVDNYYQQVQVISRQGKLIRVLHGRALQFARPICAVPKGDNQIVVMSEFGSVVVIEKYL